MFGSLLTTSDHQQQCKLAKSIFKKALESGASKMHIRDVSNWQVAEGGKSSKKATRCDSAVFFDDTRYEEFVYMSPGEFLETTTARVSADLRKDYVGHCSFADMVVPIEAKARHNHCAFEFDHPSRHVTREHADGGMVALGQIGQYIGTIFGRQHRTHVLSVYVYRNKARLVYTDRDACVVSTPFAYAQPFGDPQSKALQTFFWRIAHASREQLGYDSSVEPATKVEFEAMLAYARSLPRSSYAYTQLCYALCINVDAGDSGPDPRRTCTQWPLQRVTRQDGSHVFIGRPRFASSALFGRCTRGFVAYDPREDGALYFMKDLWRVDHPEIEPEHEIYEQLHANDVTNIPTCLGGEDVGSDTARGWQRSRTLDIQVLLGSAGIDKEPQLRARGHYRIFFKEVLLPVTDFANFQELVLFLADALYGGCEPSLRPVF